jgi:hypothetical protein
MPKVTCLQGQRLLIGQEICLTINAIYKKRDGMRCVMLDIETPAGMLVFQERLATETEESGQGKLSKIKQVQREQGIEEELEELIEA